MKDAFFLSINKPVGVSSFKALSAVKKFFGTKKVGHMGTLDPLASGVLPVAVGEATKLINYVETEPKEYIVEIYFGMGSKSLDSEGVDLENLVKVEQSFELESVIEIMDGFLGKIDQVPPKFSAVHVDGKRAYDLARSGSDFELKARSVEMFSYSVIDFSWPVLKMKLSVGSGFYVRSLVRDLALQLRVEAFMLNLVRSRVGVFSLENSVDVDGLSQDSVISVESVLSDFEKYELSEGEYVRVRNGVELKYEEKKKEGEFVLGMYGSKAVSVLEARDGRLKVVKNLNVI